MIEMMCFMDLIQCGDRAPGPGRTGPGTVAAVQNV
jgi:hypothetical protein